MPCIKTEKFYYMCIYKHMRARAHTHTHRHTLDELAYKIF